MKKQLNQLKKFQKSFKGVINNTPTLLSNKEWNLRYKLSKEELNEYRDACKSKNLTEIADAIADRLFLVLGDAVAHGLDKALPEIFEEVVASNMSKLDKEGNPIINGENGVIDHSQPIGKILKSRDYFKPNIAEILKKYM